MKLWFKAKHYGYGWYPATIEGWAVTIGFVIALLVPQSLIPFYGEKNISGFWFAVLYFSYASILTVLLLWICVKKGEKAAWRWGDK